MNVFALRDIDNELINIGIPEEYIQSLSYDAKSDLYNVLLGYTLQSVDVETVYLNEQPTTRGSISSSTLQLKALSGTICRKNTNIVTGVLVTLTWDWAYNRPYIRRTDSISVNWDQTLFYCGEDSFYARDLAKDIDDDDWTTMREYVSPATSSQGGIGFYTVLNGSANYVSGSCLLILTPTGSLVTGDDYGTSINVNYVHNRKLTNSAIGFSVLNGTVNIDVSGSFYDEASATTSVRFSK